jgi:hypothetical protein
VSTTVRVVASARTHFSARTESQLSISGALVRRRNGTGIPTPVLSREGDNTMRFCVMVRATKDSESGAMPSEKMLAEMGRYNEELVKAGVMLAAKGCTPVRRERASAFPATSAP